MSCAATMADSRRLKVSELFQSIGMMKARDWTIDMEDSERIREELLENYDRVSRDCRILIEISARSGTLEGRFL